MCEKACVDYNRSLIEHANWDDRQAGGKVEC